ncbi:MAG: SPOR domain-containing protein [Blastocatellia bacterium]
MFAVILLLFAQVDAQGVAYTVQLGALSTKEEAEEQVRQLKAKDVNAYIVKSVVPGKGTMYRVRAGIFSTQSEAKKYGAALQQQGVISEFFAPAYEKPAEETAARFIANPSVSSAISPKTNQANNPALSATSTPPSGFIRFRDSKIGYSFDYPAHWTGQPFTDGEASEQRIDAGAMFSSQKGASFLYAVWNKLEKANNPSSENDLIVEVILKSMSSGNGLKLEETSRLVENQDGLIKTYLDLNAVFQPQGQSAPFDFLGKAVIIRASRGIMLVVAYYSKDGAPNAAIDASKIIASVRAPE